LSIVVGIELISLSLEVYIVTGSNTGVGKELARMLYSKNAKVYIAARSEERANKAIQEINTASPTSKGSLVFLPLDLSDLSTIKASAQRFLAAETKLHVLFNNAGVQNSDPFDTAKTKQGYEIHMGINCLGTFLFTKFLTPVLIATAKAEPPNTVRVVWVSSSGTELAGAKNTGVEMDNMDNHIENSFLTRYGFSKAGNWLQGVEFAKRYKADGVIGIPLNPGNLQSDLYRQAGLGFKLATGWFMHPVVNGAWTELFAGLSPKITLEKTGSWGEFDIVGRSF
jgi:NAD(P)-dependent dehydrogenase (short-subunit alcohol dehydrogenase family)